MKILVISHMYPTSYSEVFGLFVHQQVKELEKQGCEVKVICPVQWAPFPIKHFSNEWKGYSDIPIRRVLEGIEVHYPRHLVFPRNILLASSGKRMYFGIRSLIADLYEDFKFDIIHAHVALPDGFAAMMLKWKYRKPLVVTIHGADMYSTVHRSRGCRKAIANVFEQADRVVLVSKQLEEMAKGNIGFEDKLIVIGNGINHREIAPVNESLATKYVGCRIMLSVCHLIARKGIGVNIKAVAQLIKKYPNLKYIVIGRGVEVPSLQRLTRDLKLEQHVEFLGELPHTKVMEYMAIADVFSLPSWNESFGVVYIEAAMHGKPVIACEGEGITDIFQNNETAVFVKPKDVESLSGAIDYLLENNQKAREIGERAKKLVLKNYTWEKNARSYLDIYKELLAQNG